MKTIFWGRYFWYCIHLTALGYSNNPTPDQKMVYKQFYLTLGKVLPCSKCSNNYARHMEHIPIDFFLGNQNDLFKWTVHLHNIVNKEIGKPQWNVEFAESFYKTYQYTKERRGEEINNNVNFVANTPNRQNENNKAITIMLIINIVIIVLFFVLVVWKLMIDKVVFFIEMFTGMLKDSLHKRNIN